MVYFNVNVEELYGSRYIGGDNEESIVKDICLLNCTTLRMNIFDISLASLLLILQAFTSSIELS